MPIGNDFLWEAEMKPYMLKEDLGCGLSYDSLLVSFQNGHLRKLINNHKNTVVVMICGW